MTKKIEKLVILKRTNPDIFEVHVNSIDRINNLLFSTRNEKLATGIVNGYNSLLTQPADVQERAKELAVDFAWENVLNHADGYQSFRKAFDTWFSGNKYHQNKFAGASSVSGMQEGEIKVTKYFLERIENTLRLCANTLESHSKTTCLDRDIMQHYEWVKSILAGNSVDEIPKR